MQNNRVYITLNNTISALGTGTISSTNNYLNRVSNIKIPENLTEKKYRLNQPYFSIDYDLLSLKPFNSKVANICINLIEQVKSELSIDTPLFIGTSTGGIDDTESHYNNLVNIDSNENRECKYSIHSNHFFNVLGDNIRNYYNGLIGKVYTISTACSSSAQALLYAYKLIKYGVIKKALVLGVDVLSYTTMIGFDSLKLVSYTGTRPLSNTRDGLNLGEGGGVLLIESEPSSDPICEVLGGASTTDGHHMSSPDPDGKYQELCMIEAMQRSCIDKSKIGFVSAHGTGTDMNDKVETLTVKRLFGTDVRFSSLKGFIGHTLGASAICELPIVIEALRRGSIVQPQGFTDPIDSDIIPTDSVNIESPYFLKNSFGFGGNNVSLVFKTLK